MPSDEKFAVRIPVLLGRVRETSRGLERTHQLAQAVSELTEVTVCPCDWRRPVCVVFDRDGLSDVLDTAGQA